MSDKNKFQKLAEGLLGIKAAPEEKAEVVEAGDEFTPESIEEVTPAPELIEEVTSEPIPIEEMAEPEPIEEVTSASMPIKEMAEPEPIEEVTSAPTPIEEMAEPEPIEEVTSEPIPIEEIAEPEPIEEVTSEPIPIEEMAEPEPIEEVTSEPIPIEEMAEPEPIEEVTSEPIPIEEMAEPEPIEEIAPVPTAVKEDVVITPVPTPKIETVVSKETSSAPVSGSSPLVKPQIPPATTNTTYDPLLNFLSSNLMQEMPEDIVSIMVKATQLLKAEIVTFEFLVKQKNMRGITICVDRPVSYYIKSLESRNIDSSKLQFIDAITIFSGKSPDRSVSNIRYITNPSDLTSLDITIMDSIEALEKESVTDGEKFLLIDCIAALQLYAEPTRLGTFVHDLAAKLRVSGVYGVFFLLHENSDGMLHHTIQSFCDQNVSLEKLYT